MAIDSDDSPQFKDALIREIFLLQLSNKTKVNDASISLTSQYLRLLTTEAIHRAAEVAENERTLLPPEERRGPALLEVRHLEKVLSGLLLDL
ncbi:BQ2448_7208 [Microbotryum intermedium]|uniref:BQ2448_7208 protein n=1 Tax=Microbotryum intermedium TaxID=269621 RepID=A0A238FHJ6_9BASI|nr:BQ2448_7208 [Microbotryum intermedium]